jgi:tetratricopeptide (TPR) repeat protein
MLSLAVLEASEGRRIEAIALLQEVIELKPGERVVSEANYRLAENYIALGKRDRAVSYLTLAVAQAPEGEWARRSEEYLKLLH